MIETTRAEAVSTPWEKQQEAMVSQVRRLASSRIERVARTLGLHTGLGALMGGKMLRGRLAARLALAEHCPAEPATVAAAAAACELAHTASLCHDDVIDNDLLRRGCPTLWRTTGRSAAVLIGDLLLCEGTDLLLETADGRCLRPFLAKVKETCTAEAEQELCWRGRRPDLGNGLRLARQKTGPLFAFAALVCGGSDGRMSTALEEAGYCVGTAYQLADDLADICGAEGAAGKTLGSDRRRGRLTLAHGSADERSRLRQRIKGLHTAALEALEEWPPMREGLDRFFAHDLGPAIERLGLDLSFC